MSGNLERYRLMQEALRQEGGVTLDQARAAVGPGWEDLAEQAWRAITKAGGRVLQVKEKFAGLRVYYNSVPPDRDDDVSGELARIIAEADRTCEWCGGGGDLRDLDYAASIGDRRQGHWWYKTLCDEHAWAFYVDDRRWWHPEPWEESQ